MPLWARTSSGCSKVWASIDSRSEKFRTTGAVSENTAAPRYDAAYVIILTPTFLSNVLSSRVLLNMFMAPICTGMLVYIDVLVYCLVHVTIAGFFVS